jgi:hypothetical protein
MCVSEKILLLNVNYFQKNISNYELHKRNPVHKVRFWQVVKRKFAFMFSRKKRFASKTFALFYGTNNSFVRPSRVAFAENV